MSIFTIQLNNHNSLSPGPDDECLDLIVASDIIPGCFWTISYLHLV